MTENIGDQSGGQAMMFQASNTIQSTSLVGYQSRGHCLVIASLDYGLEVIEKLSVKSVTLLVMDNQSQEVQKQATDGGVKVITAKVNGLTGHLGAFDCAIGDPESPGSLAKVAGVSVLGGFDTVLDLTSTPIVDVEVYPFGYYAPAGSEDELSRALAEIPEMEGEFEKPKYFEYDPTVCAHSRSGITACTNCLDVCATGAITSDGDGISIEPYLCQGCGSCASSCPSGAVRYAFPAPADAMAQLSDLLAERRDAGIQKSIVFLHDSEQGAERLQAFENDLDQAVLPVAVEEVASIGMDGWLCALAYGATAIVVDVPAEGSAMQKGLEQQVEITDQILQGLGLQGRVRLLNNADSQVLNAIVDVVEPAVTPAGFKTFNDKRQTTRMALDYLAGQSDSVPAAIDLPARAPFGLVNVDKASCTLCLACVTVCPARALQDGETLPQLKFIESSCLQCGMCEQACPENAISLSARYLYSSEDALKPRILNEEKPFNCVVCNTPFATERIIGRMQAKLSDHWMFGDDKSMRRLKMCEDCRVKDIFESESGIDVHKT